jgi:hypothetical protein
MGRFSPSVLPEQDSSFADFAHGLADSLDRRRERKRTDKLDKTAEENRARQQKREDLNDEYQREERGRRQLEHTLNLYNAGYREGAPPQQTAHDLAAAVEARGNRLQSQGAYQPPPPPTPQPGNQTQMGGPPGAYPQAAGPAMPAPMAPSPMQQLGQKFYIPVGSGYIDPEATPDARKARREDEVDTRRHQQELEVEGTRQTNRLAADEADNERDDRRALEGYDRDDRRESGRQRHERLTEAERSRRAQSVAEIRAAALRGGGSDMEEGPVTPKTLDARGRHLDRQMADTRTALGEEGEQLSWQGPQADSTAYRNLAGRLDSLRGVRDEVAAARGGDPQAADGILRGINHSNYTTSVGKLSRRRDQLIAKAGGNQQLIERINAAYADDVNKLSRSFATGGPGSLAR